MKTFHIAILVLIVIAAIIGLSYYFFANPQKDSEFYDFVVKTVEDKIYPDYKYYEINITPPNVYAKIVESMSADDKGVCISCYSRTHAIKSIISTGFFYNYSGYSYVEALKNAAKYKIEVNSYPLTEEINDFNYYITFYNKSGIVNDIQIYLNPGEPTIRDMTYDEVKSSFTSLQENITISSTYPTLSKGENCFWFHPWQISYNKYDITVPNGLINYTVDDKGKCNVSVTSQGNKINVVANCKLYTSDLCPSGQWPSEGKFTCDYPKVEICYN